MLILSFIASFGIIFLITGLMYGDLNRALITFIYVMLVIIYQITLISIISIFFGNMMCSIAMSIGAWIFTVVIISISDKFLLLNPFDQSQYISKYIVQNITNSQFILDDKIILYILIYVALFLLISFKLSKKWIVSI